MVQPPSANDVGVDAVASLPEMTDVGARPCRPTRTAAGWPSSPGSTPRSRRAPVGSVGAVRAPGVAAGPQRRPRRRPTTHPDIAAVADPFTGVKIVFNQQVVVGGGTSLAAPVWAGLAALMTQYLKQRGGREIGDLNPMLYRVAAGARCPRSATSRWAATPWRWPSRAMTW